MRKRLLTILLALSIVITCTPYMAEAATGLPPIDDPSVCYTPSSDYKGGYCVLTSCKTMFRRLAIMRGSLKWKTITNAAVKPYAAPSGGLKYSFSYKNDGLRYNVSHGYFKGSTVSEKREEMRELLKTHPEGIIVWGSKATKYGGPHGVLVVKVGKKQVYAIDSAYNRGNYNLGVQKWSNTIMGSLKKCTKYWCVTSYSGSASTKSTGESVLNISGVRAPESIVKGKGFTIRGDIGSNYKITSVNVSVIDSEGNAVISRTVEPNAYSYDVYSMDKYIKFGTLDAGTYTYRITAEDKKKSATLHECSFVITDTAKVETAAAAAVVTEEADPSTLSISGVRAPEKLKLGAAFTIKGIIKSNYKITKVQVAVIDSNGDKVINLSVKPNKKKYSILSLDDDIKFGQLPKGKYTYKVIAKDSMTKKTLVKKKFTVS